MRAITMTLAATALSTVAAAQPPASPGVIHRDRPVLQPARPRPTTVLNPRLIQPGLLPAGQPRIPIPQDMLIHQGMKVLLGGAPWQIQLRFAGTLSQPAPGVTPRPEWSRRHLCGGTLIAPRWVLTAGHCLFDRKTNPPRLRADTEFEVRAGMIDIDNAAAGTVLEVRKVRVFLHPDYEHSQPPSPGAPHGRPAANDFALLLLDSPMPTDKPSDIKPAFPSLLAQTLQPGDPVSLVGWGALHRDANLMSSSLQAAALKIVSRAACNAVYTAPGQAAVITDAVFCADGKTSTGLIVDSCSGDSGGALIRVSGAIVMPIGVSSWGSCGQGRPAVYGRIGHVRDWIVETMNLIPPVP